MNGREMSVVIKEPPKKYYGVSTLTVAMDTWTYISDKIGEN